MDRHLLDIHPLAVEVTPAVLDESFLFPACPAHKPDATEESSEKMQSLKEPLIS